MKDVRAEFLNFKELPFPIGMTGMEIADINIVLLDSDTAGLIDKYISHGQLDKTDSDTLRICFNEIGTILKELSGNDREYFILLSEIVNLVIRNG